MIILGLTLLLGGGVLYVGARSGLWQHLPLGRLPGDIHIQSGNFSFFFPVVTCILLSIVLTIFLNLIIRLINK